MQKEIYNEFYKKHGAGVHSDPVRFTETAKLCKGRVLDVACGTGDLADFYKGEYMGVDISDVAIEYAEENRRDSAVFYIEDFTKEIIGKDKYFDTIVMAEFLEHIENDDVVFENIKRVAKDDARIIISLPNGNRIPDENHLREFTVPELRKRFSKLGKVKFHNWNGFKHRILMTVDLGEKNEETIALSMMVRSEEKGLEKAILSCIEFVDEIVISVDSKSNDGTLKIAERYGDVVKKHVWENDFGKARNFTDEGIKSKWILSLDGHEFVEEYPNLAEKLKQDVDGLYITVKMEGGDTFVNTRIYKAGQPWSHAIHNTVKVETTEKYTGFVIVHDRAGGQSPKSTQERMEQVRDTMGVELKKELKIPGCEVRALFYLARYYRQFREWKKAIKYYKKYLKKSPHKSEKWLCAYEAGMISNGIRKPTLALKFFNMANEAIPNRWEILKRIGLTYVSFESYEKAVDYLVESLHENTDEFRFNPEERNDGHTWDNIGICFFHLGKYFEAKTAWERAIEIGTDKIQIKLNKKRVEMLERQHGV